MAKRSTKAKPPKPELIRVIFEITKWDPDFYCHYFKGSKHFPANSMIGHRTHIVGAAMHPAEYKGVTVDLRFIRVARQNVGDDETRSVGDAALGTDEDGHKELNTYVRIDVETSAALVASIGVRAHKFGVLVLQPLPRKAFHVSELELCAELHERDLALIEGRPPVEPD